MNETDLRDELERASAHLHPHADAQAVWELGTRARRRHRAMVVAGTAAAAAAVVIGGVAVRSIDSATPDPRPPATNPTPSDDSVETGRIPYLTDDQVRPEFDADDLASAPWDDASAVRSWDPVDPVPLVEDPVEHAGLVVQSDEDEPNGIWVLGDDGRWRSLDLSGLEFSNVPDANMGVESGSLSPDGTRLALGQTDTVVVVDLTTGVRRTYDVPRLGPKGWGRYVAWSGDAETLYVGLPEPEGEQAWAIDLATAQTNPVPFAPADSTFLDDGRVVETFASERTGSQVRVYSADGQLVFRSRVVKDDVLDDLDALAARDDRVAAYLHGYGKLTRSDPVESPATPSGVVVLEAANARPRTFLPVTAESPEGEAGMVGWRGDDTVLFVVHREDPSAEIGWTSYVLAWNVESGRITRVADFSAFETYAVVADHLP